MVYDFGLATPDSDSVQLHLFVRWSTIDLCGDLCGDAVFVVRFPKNDIFGKGHVFYIPVVRLRFFINIREIIDILVAPWPDIPSG